MMVLRIVICVLYSTVCQELQNAVLRFREDLVALRTAADHMEEKLKAEILFLKEQIQAEQCLKENLEDTLQLEIEGCKEEIGKIRCPEFKLYFEWIHFDQLPLRSIIVNIFFFIF